MNKSTHLGPVFSLCVVMGIGCAPSSQLTHPDFGARKVAIQRVLLVEPDVTMYEVRLGGLIEKMDDWSGEASEHVNEALDNVFVQRELAPPARLVAADLPEAEQDNLRATRAQFNAVNISLLQHQFGESTERFQEQREHFYHSLGAEVRTLDPSVDAYLFIWGIDHKSSGGRKAAQAGTVLLGAVFGVAVVPALNVTGLSAALVDANDGAVLWYRHVRKEGGADLRKPESVEGLMQKLLHDLPVALSPSAPVS